MSKDDAKGRARVAAFARENWDALAAAAWRGFKKQGRGGLLVEWTAIESWEAGRPTSLTPHYITYTEVPRFGRLISSYDPEHALVLAVVAPPEEKGQRDVPAAPGQAGMRIIRAGASFRVWIFDGEPAPPDALRQAAN